MTISGRLAAGLLCLCTLCACGGTDTQTPNEDASTQKPQMGHVPINDPERSHIHELVDDSGRCRVTVEINQKEHEEWENINIVTSSGPAGEMIISTIVGAYDGCDWHRDQTLAEIRYYARYWSNFYLIDVPNNKVIYAGNVTPSQIQGYFKRRLEGMTFAIDRSTPHQEYLLLDQLEDDGRIRMRYEIESEGYWYTGTCLYSPKDGALSDLKENEPVPSG